MPRYFLLLFAMVVLLDNRAMAVEEPPYHLVLQDGAFELRQYPALVAAEVAVGGDQDQAGNAGFRLLAGYIFGGNQARESIAMTAPVVQTDSGGSWTVRFMMPSKWTLDRLPVPNDARVHLAALNPTTVAVLRFPGLAFAADVAARTEELRKLIAQHHREPIGPASLARYNPPWTLWFLRRNEVMIPVRD